MPGASDNKYNDVNVKLRQRVNQLVQLDAIMYSI